MYGDYYAFRMDEWTIHQKEMISADYINFFTYSTHILYETVRTHTQQSTNSSPSTSSPRACFNLCFFLSTVSTQNSQSNISRIFSFRAFRITDPWNRISST
jgi:hypothetical protein